MAASLNLEGRGLSADLIAAWCELSGDPGQLTAPWMWEGTPAGVLEHRDVGDAFPEVTGNDPDPHESLSTYADASANYPGMD